MVADSVFDDDVPAVSDEAKQARRLSRRRGLFAPDLLKRALVRSFVMLRPDILWKNPVMFTVEVGTVLSIIGTVRSMLGWGGPPTIYLLALDVWLLLTVLFANFAEALAEARGKAQTEALRKTRQATPAYRLLDNGRTETTVSTLLRAGDRVVVEAGQVIPGDGEVIEGVASIDESAITGESAPVIREAGGDRTGVTGGTRVLSDRIFVEVTAEPGHSFLDRMIALVEGAIRHRTPNEIAVALVLAAFTLVFLLVTATLLPMSLDTELYMKDYLGIPAPVKSLGTDVPTLVALLVCLIPTTIGALLAAIGIAGMDRALRADIIAKSGKSVELAGDVDTLLLDKTCTITIGNRKATQFVPLGGTPPRDLARLSGLASMADQTPEGSSILELARRNTSLEGEAPHGSRFIAFSAYTRMSGIDIPDGTQIRKGAPETIAQLVESRGGIIPDGFQACVDSIASNGATPLAVAENDRLVGVVKLEDILKQGIRQRLMRLRRMGLHVVMITGDNPPTAKAIAEQAGVDDFLAQATPEAKLAYIRREQQTGKLVAMMGDGTNDAPALAQADVGVAMNSGTQAAKEAGNMVDLDSSTVPLPSEVVPQWRQQVMFAVMKEPGLFIAL